MWRVLASLALVSFASCASTPSVQRVQVPDLESEVHADAARVYIIRSHDIVGGEQAVIVYDGKREIGRLGRGHHLVWDHAAGRRLLTLVFDRPALEGGGIEKLVDHKSEGGETIYYELRLRYAAKEGALGRGPGTPIADRIEEAEALRLLAKSTAASFEAER